MDVSAEIVAQSDQMNAIDLAQPVTVTIVGVKKGADERVHIITDVYGPARPFKPSKTVLRDIAKAWGLESQVWIGRRLTLFNDPTVLWAGQEVGGIRVSAMSHIDKAFEAKHQIARTKSKKVMIQPLPDAAPIPTDTSGRDWLTELTDTSGDLSAIVALGKAAKTAHAGDDINAAILAEWQRVKTEGVGA